MSNAAVLETLERRLADIERKANALIETINDLRAEDGLSPRSPSGGGGGGVGSASGVGSGNATLMQIKPDTFYAKKMQTAAREYLEMRYASAGNRSDPATPKEIFDAITKGGYQFDAKDETVALVSLRALLRKRTAFFHKLPNGTYGLPSWYPDAKKPKATADDANADDANADELTNDDLDVSEAKTATTTKAAAAS
jgi:hypothetical protein